MAEPEPPSPDSGGPATILIVDDARVGREEMARLVESLGYRALCADNGLEGLRLVREAHPSLVLLDMVMPGLDGLKVAAAIKAQPRFIPVILLTGLTDLETKRRGQAAGADDFLAKPVTAVELSIRIAAMLRIKALTDALEAAKRRLAELAETDALTGLPNRRSFDLVHAAELERARRYRRPLSLLVIDVDHFKRINDARGHPAGDEVLRAVAEALAASVRRSDRVCRYGGEEFVVVAPETIGDGAGQLGERLRAVVAGLVVPIAGDPVRVTVSVGVATWDVTDPRPDGTALLARADQALYEAKQTGRDRVVRRDL
jgi:diguanylate cyclase (GGDEF)-like protein